METCLTRLQADKHPVTSLVLGLPRPMGCLPLPNVIDHIPLDNPIEDDDFLLQALVCLEHPYESIVLDL